MSHSDVTYEPPAPPDPAEASLGQLVSSVSQQIPELVRSEIRLAQAEMAEKGKRAGLGLGMFGAAGVLALYGVGTLLATVVLLLALVLPAWAAALIVTVVLFAAAGVAALKGKANVAEATPPKPERAIDGIKADVETVKGNHP
ncbi:phage holin family protein [Nocardioides marmoribigeumensis]|jgi:uncharacterized membrane protein YqjE|uniref:Membrane protein YqjE n=1 Tax=Nocardioides marmoribigeumensis TaxID=433649 RepID=A0ABU2BWJ5_9ACTN|nr:phage holin family protein [Nocardioides marmoribigeumensis]MDR7362218.1 putative membrane protein YqjE [Nocardioides marmoribigeumensis]